MENLYRIRGLCFRYRLGVHEVAALRDIDLDIGRGESVCLVGPSGSGKTTLLNVLGLIEPVRDGDVRFLGEELGRLPASRQNHLRRFELGFIFQQFHLLPVLDAQENVEYFLIGQKLASSERQRRVRDALEAVGMWDQRRQRPLEMSGGQRQRVAVARALAKEPRVIIADEPTASLDQDNGRQVMELLLALQRDRGVTVIIASHDTMVHQMVRRLVRLRDGCIVADGQPAVAAG